jgi:protein involved in polysaccharide export with SLBB domain
VRNTEPGPAVVENPEGDGESNEVTVVLESGPEVIAVDTYELLELGRPDLNVMLRDGDVVNVPEAMSFYVVGFVEKPGGYPLTRPTTVLEGVALAGGLRERRASPRRCALKRYIATGEIVRPLDLVAISRGEDPNIYLQPDDVIDVRQTPLRGAGLWFFDFVRAIFNVGYSIPN